MFIQKQTAFPGLFYVSLLSIEVDFWPYLIFTYDMLGHLSIQKRFQILEERFMPLNV